jgi:hypothetical protein
MSIIYKTDIVPTAEKVIALTYYPKVGFTKEDRAFLIARAK